MLRNIGFKQGQESLLEEITLILHRMASKGKKKSKKIKSKISSQKFISFFF